MLDTGPKVFEANKYTPFEDIASHMQTDIVGMPNSRRALRITRPIMFDGVLRTDGVLVDAPQKMKRVYVREAMFKGIWKALP